MKMVIRNSWFAEFVKKGKGYDPEEVFTDTRFAEGSWYLDC